VLADSGVERESLVASVHGLNLQGDTKYYMSLDAG